MIQIPLANGMVATLDNADHEQAQFNWSPFQNQAGVWYARRTVKSDRTKSGYTSVYLHGAIAQPPVGYEVDHRDGNGLNNTRANLRVATSAQNNSNKGLTVRNRSGFKGVYWSKRDRVWRAQITANGTKYHLGSFNDPAVAAQVYDDVAIELHGEFAVTNAQLVAA